MSTEFAFDDLMKFVYQQSGITPELLRKSEAIAFTKATASSLNKAVDIGIQQSKPSDIMVQRLKESNYVFSGFKTFHEMKEAFPSLIDEEGNKKPFQQFLKEVQTVNEKYNSHYLQAEYNFAVTSAEMAAKWEQFEEDGDRYNLQYRTVGDDRVRESHRKLDGVTLPPSSPFWNEYFPPNGWKCFPAKTAIMMADGTWKYIESIRHGELVIGGSGKAQLVVGTHVRAYNGEMVSIVTERATTTCTPNHRFFSAKGWTTAADLTTGDILIQVGKVGTFNKIVNAIHNLYTLGSYAAMSLIRQWKSIRTHTVDNQT